MTLHGAKRTSAACIAIAALAPLTGCGGDDKPEPPAFQRILDTERVERAIEQSIREQRDRAAAVTCPDGVPQRANWRFTCTAHTRKGKPTKFTVIQKDDRGNVRYEAE